MYCSNKLAFKRNQAALLIHINEKPINCCLMSCCSVDVLQPPKAKKESHTITAPHGAEREDVYYWLRDDDRTDPQILDYLKVFQKYKDMFIN